MKHFQKPMLTKKHWARVMPKEKDWQKRNRQKEKPMDLRMPMVKEMQKPMRWAKHWHWPILKVKAKLTDLSWQMQRSKEKETLMQTPRERVKRLEKETLMQTPRVKEILKPMHSDLKKPREKEIWKPMHLVRVTYWPKPKEKD